MARGKRQGLISMTTGEYNAMMWNVQRANDACRAAEKHNAQGRVEDAAEAWRNYHRYVANVAGIEERCS